MAHSDRYSYVVFPYLKTSQRFDLGGLHFRSTEDRTELEDVDRDAVAKISDMIFLQNSLRIKSSTYALIPVLPDYQENEALQLQKAKDIQSVIAYCYAAPHPEFGTSFLHLESSDLLTFTEDRVTDFLVWPEHHSVDTDPVREAEVVGPPEMRMRAGFRGYRNLTVPFWVAEGCRIYPPIPHITLNLSQDLFLDVKQFHASQMYGGLLGLLDQPLSGFRSRIFTAVEWFNRTVAMTTDEPTAIIQLAIAFEALLKLPNNEKTERFVDAISLLLGRVDRLDLWAHQFYNLRSQIAHEGRAPHTRFVVKSSKNSKEEGSFYNSILLFGRQIFQACVSALVFGERLAREKDLSAKLFTNGERLASLCKILADDTNTSLDRLKSVKSLVLDCSKYRYIPETGLTFDLIAGSVRQISRCLLDSGEPIEAFQRADLQAAAQSTSTFECFEALERLCKGGSHHATPANTDEERSADLLYGVAWHYSFMAYYQWKQSKPTG